MSSASLRLGGRLLKRGQLLTPRTNVFAIQVASISGKTLRTEDKFRPAPWPYKTRGYNGWHTFIDGTEKRFDDNTKVVFIEGPPASGKTELAKALAEEFEMEYFPMAMMDMVYVNPYGFDLRSLDTEVPKSMRTYDEKRFIREPKDKKSIFLQISKVQLRTDQYMDALAHLYNTGQGIIMDRSPYSDFVFIEAMYKCGYIDKTAYKTYYQYYDGFMKLILKPHLVVYLDSPVDVVTANLKKRGEGEEKTITPLFLETMEEAYKLKFLRDIETHAEVLVYDWSRKGDPEVVIEDIERINFDSFEEDIHNEKMKDWRVRDDDMRAENRWTYTNWKYSEMMKVMHNVDYLPCDGLCDDLDDKKIWQELIEEKVPSLRYAYGYNPDAGDSVLWKTKDLPQLISQRNPVPL